MDYSARVAAGMAWLDSFKPGWERDIDLATLDLADGCNCVCGQALQDLAVAARWPRHNREGRTNSFGWAWERMPAEPHELGFVPTSLGNYDDLQAEWCTQIKRRFDSGVLSDDVAGRPA